MKIPISKNSMLLLVPVALVACDPPAKNETSAADPREHSPAVQSSPLENTPLNSKFKPFVVDLGGAQAAQATECALTVEFGSIGTGADTESKQRIDRLLEESSAVVEVEQFIVGREGEAVLCIRLGSKAKADRLFDQLQLAALNGYMVSIQSESGKMFHSRHQHK